MGVTCYGFAMYTYDDDNDDDNDDDVIQIYSYISGSQIFLHGYKH